MLGIVYRVSFQEECNVITRESSRVHDDIIFIVKALSVKEERVATYLLGRHGCTSPQFGKRKKAEKQVTIVKQHTQTLY